MRTLTAVCAVAVLMSACGTDHGLAPSSVSAPSVAVVTPSPAPGVTPPQEPVVPPGTIDGSPPHPGPYPLTCKPKEQHVVWLENRLLWVSSSGGIRPYQWETVCSGLVPANGTGVWLRCPRGRNEIRLLDRTGASDTCVIVVH